MNDSLRPEAWDMPVVRALDAIETLPGLERVEFGQFRFSVPSVSGPVHTAMVHAYRPVTSARFTVKFAVRGTTYTVRDHDGQALTASGVADLLHLPLASADRAVTLLKRALTESLRIYNRAHAPTQHGAGRPAPATAGPSEPWPFAARTSTDALTGPGL
ncbi:hypothetical protein ACFT2C_04735 [Promicromonospora sp. NPDC057138]|uniref:hypothetical protein n=1 Tax=Promicromonospora sp. NPDC057138 TaxID=3346031 RepID=UPI00362C27DD